MVSCCLTVSVTAIFIPGKYPSGMVILFLSIRMYTWENFTLDALPAATVLVVFCDVQGIQHVHCTLNLTTGCKEVEVEDGWGWA